MCLALSLKGFKMKLISDLASKYQVVAEETRLDKMTQEQIDAYLNLAKKNHVGEVLGLAFGAGSATSDIIIVGKKALLTVGKDMKPYSVKAIVPISNIQR